MGYVVFVAGIHGVGKSTLCKSVIDPMGVKHLTASEIIKKYREVHIDNKTKYAANIDANQIILIEGLRQESINEPVVVLDGHFALLNEQGDIVAIDTTIFDQLSLSAIVVIMDEPAKIEGRLLSRDGKGYGVNRLSKMQDVELQQATEVAHALDVPLLTIDFRIEEEASSILAKFLSTYM